MAEVDRLDATLVQLLGRRFHCSRAIGAIKRHQGLARYDPRRVQEQQLNFVRQCVEAGLDGDMAQALIDTILRQVIAERGSRTAD